MSKTANHDKPSHSTQDTANVVARSLSHGAPQEVLVTEAQSAAFCHLANTAKPATPELCSAAQRAKRFKFLDR